MQHQNMKTSHFHFMPSFFLAQNWKDKEQLFLGKLFTTQHFLLHTHTLKNKAEEQTQEHKQT